MDYSELTLLKEQKTVLSVSLLVSNRKDTIRKCLDSIKPLLDSIPGELIVVDTVGEENSDGSLEIAKEYTDKIVHFDWCNDFAAARNAGLKEACGEWFLFLDDDEWFEDVSEIIEFFSRASIKITGQYITISGIIIMQREQNIQQDFVTVWHKWKKIQILKARYMSILHLM